MLPRKRRNPVSSYEYEPSAATGPIGLAWRSAVCLGDLELKIKVSVSPGSNPLSRTRAEVDDVGKTISPIPSAKGVQEAIVGSGSGSLSSLTITGTSELHATTQSVKKQKASRCFTLQYPFRTD